jgi:hypothetical protein
MTDLLQVLRDDAAELAEHDLPTTEELRGVVAALINRLAAIAAEPDTEPEDERVQPVGVQPTPETVTPGTTPAAAPVTTSAVGPEQVEPRSVDNELARRRELEQRDTRVDREGGDAS